jgi:radical SAM protein with 4Fe4S-binding SPASM domain
MEKPHNIALELVRGCNLACEFCAIDVVPKEKAFMTEETFMSAINGVVPWNPIRMEFCGRGEVTLHPDIIKYTKIWRSIMDCSYLNIISNGVAMSRDMAKELLKSGANCLLIDCYGNTYDKFKDRFDGLAPIITYGETSFTPFCKHPKNTKVICLIPDIKKHSGEIKTRELHNVAGNLKRVPPLKEPLGKICVDPFRFITIFWDGTFVLCCRDWKEEYKISNVNDTDLQDEWINNEALNVARKKLMYKDRNFGICKRCNWHGGFRKGLIFANKEFKI